MNKVNLSEISKPIRNELTVFEQTFGDSIRSKINLVDLVAKYILKQKGKKIRPLLVLLAAKACGEISDRTYRGATLVELLHSATLIHDDVVDNAEQRRGLPSINAVWKNKIAVLMGDYLLARGLMIAVNGKDFDFLEVITNTVKRMSEGELLQIQKTRKLDIDEDTYFQVISDKTASLLETCCEIGAASTTDDPEHRIAMKNYGLFLGISFQIQDDILDYEGSFKLFGKAIGTDIKDKKITLPLIYALNNSSPKEAASIRKLMKGKKTKDTIKEIIEFVHEKKGIEYSHKMALDYAHRAIKSIEPVPDSVSKQSLTALANFVVERKN